MNVSAISVGIPTASEGHNGSIQNGDRDAYQTIPTEEPTKIVQNATVASMQINYYPYQPFGFIEELKRCKRYAC